LQGKHWYLGLGLTKLIHSSYSIKKLGYILPTLQKNEIKKKISRVTKMYKSNIHPSTLNTWEVTLENFFHISRVSKPVPVRYTSLLQSIRY
jgi:hypothetical protein